MPRTPIPDPVDPARMAAFVEVGGYYLNGWRAAWRTPTKAARMANAKPAVDSHVAAIEARAQGAADGLARRSRCQRCGLALTDTLSVARQVGPDCWAKGYRATRVEAAEPTLDA